MKAAEYFESVRSMERELQRRSWMVEDAEKKLDMVKSAVGASSRGGGDPSWRIADAIERLDSRRRLLVASVDALLDYEDEADRYIYKLLQAPNGDNMVDVLKLRYECLYENKEIAAKMGVTVRSVQQWAADAFEWYDTLRLFDREPPKFMW